MPNQAEDNLSNIIDWRIPRPSLHTSSGTNSSTSASNYERNIKTIYTLEMMPTEKLDDVRIDLPDERNWFSSGRSSSSNSTSSSHSDSSGALLLTPGNLNRILHDAITVKPADTQSIASSTHFTLVNGVTLNRKQRHQNCWRRHQLTIVVITMTIVLFFAIVGAVLFVESQTISSCALVAWIFCSPLIDQSTTMYFISTTIVRAMDLRHS